MHVAILAVACCAVDTGGPVSVNLEDMARALRGDVRVIAMGDSMSNPTWGRVPLATLRVWPIPRVRAVCGSAPEYGQFIRALARCQPTVELLWSDPGKYSAMRQEKVPEYFSLPVRGIREAWTGDGFAADPLGRLFQFRFDDGPMHGGAAGPFAQAGDQLRFRLLYWATRDPQEMMVPGIEIRDLDDPVALVDLLGGARPLWHLGEMPGSASRPAVPLQINAVAQDVSANQDVENTLRMRLVESQPLSGTDRYLNPAGAVYYHVGGEGHRAPGFYFGYLADSGWNYEGFGCDQAAEHEADRRFSLTQLVHWLDVTTLDRAQPTVFLWYLSGEYLHYDDAKIAIEAMVAQADKAAASVGIELWQHLLVMPHMYRFGSLGETPAAHAWMQEQRDAMATIAGERSNVGFASIYDATDGVVFDGTEDGNAWLLAHGFDAFEYGTNVVDLVGGALGGDLLDAADLHPSHADAGAFYAAVLGDVIRQAGCPADLSGDGWIDVQDLLAVLDDWGGATADTTGDGAVDVEDLLAVVSAWGDCWPLQPPFGT